MSDNITAIIPARGGSKGVSGKNVKLLTGYPLIAYSIIACRLANNIDRVIISTDSEEIAEIGKSFGAEVPFIRPPELAKDNSLDFDFLLHAFKWLKENEDISPDIFALIRPTTPLREPEVLDNAIKMFFSDKPATSLRSARELSEPVQKMMGLDGKYLTGLFPEDIRPEYFNLPRQSFPPSYWPNGYIDIVKRETLTDQNSVYGENAFCFITPEVCEIDTIEDFEFVEYQLSRKDITIFKYLKEHY